MKYVIIGNSAGAVGAVQGIREYDKDGKITVISDEIYHTYSRPLISYRLKGTVTEEKMKYRGDSFYTDNNVEALFGKRVEKISPDAHEVILDSGERIGYDKLLAATGSRPFVPHMDGLESIENKFTFMKLDDVKALEAAIKQDMNVLIVGAGLIGLKAAEAIEHFGVNITVVDLADRILPSILDEAASDIMKKHIESHGVNFILGTSVDKFENGTAYLKSGDSVSFDIVILAVGVRPNTELISEAGGKVARGIVTDDMQLTSLPDVYAAGDCTESYDISTGANKILALLPNAFFQGETAGRNMAGADAHYTNAIPMNAIGFFGLHIITAGSYDGESFTEQTAESYKRLAVKDNMLKGFILMGDVDRAGIYTSLIKEQIPLGEVDFEMMKKRPQMMAFGKARRKEKLGGVSLENQR